MKAPQRWKNDIYDTARKQVKEKLLVTVSLNERVKRRLYIIEWASSIQDQGSDHQDGYIGAFCFVSVALLPLLRLFRRPKRRLLFHSLLVLS